MTTLTDWLDAQKMTQDAFAMKVGLTQGRISQIAARGTRDLATAQRIEAATGGAVKLADLVPEDWRDAFPSAAPA